MDFLKEKDKKRQFFFTYGAFIINGMLALSVGSLLPYIRDARGLEYAFCGLIVSLHSVGNLISSFAGGLLPVWIGRKKSILIFETFFAVSYLLILFSHSNPGLALAFLLTGLARGAASNFCNASINSLAPGKAWTINGLHGMFSVGAFLFPILLTLLTMIDVSYWIYAVYFMLAMGILGWLLYFMMPVANDRLERAGSGGSFAFFKDPLFYLCSLTLFFYLCAEQGVIGWMVTYFKDTGLLGESLSQVTASVLWIMILAGRLTTAWASTKTRKENLLPVMGVALVLFFVLLIFSRSTFWIVAGIMGFGYSMAGIYPTTVSFTGNLIQKYPMAWNFILTFASIGSILMPSVIGKIAEATNITYGMSAIGAVLLVDLVCIILLSAYVRRRRID
ncbi:MAG: MFS transporter [Candidatus Gastranaerophilales bacterium]|nr:MFS transporter [Candidatus Gastranaerophilales bacterium]